MDLELCVFLKVGSGSTSPLQGTAFFWEGDGTLQPKWTTSTQMNGRTDTEPQSWVLLNAALYLLYRHQSGINLLVSLQANCVFSYYSYTFLIKHAKQPFHAIEQSTVTRCNSLDSSWHTQNRSGQKSGHSCCYLGRYSAISQLKHLTCAIPVCCVCFCGQAGGSRVLGESTE